MERRLAAILAADAVGYSRLMEVDEAGTLAALNAHRDELIHPKIAEHKGRVVKLMGDGVLVEFPSVVEAVRCALEVQTGLSSRNAGLAPDRRIDFRIGINLGDVMVEGDDLYGDGVNIAARLERLAEPGGICVSRTVFNHVRGKADLAFEDLGDRAVKNIAAPLHVYRIVLDAQPRDAQPRDARPRDGKSGDARPGDAGEAGMHPLGLHQDIRFCRAPDGVRLAYATVGDGPPLVKTANWLNHLEYDWESVLWRPRLVRLAERHRLIRYDARGSGLSDWDVADISFEAFVQDLETVVDAAGLERFALWGLSQGCPVSIAYAVRHPERVSHLVLLGGYALGRDRRDDPAEAERGAVLRTLIRQGWGDEHSALLPALSTMMIPGASTEQVRAMAEMQRRSASAENAMRIRKACDEIDVVALLPDVAVPTLVLHSRHDSVAPLEEGRRMASAIPGARFVSLESENHTPLPDEPAWERFLAETEAFLSES